MDRTPTLQDLAIYARDAFGEDGYPFADGNLSSFDVVVQAYAHESDGEEVRRTAGIGLRRWLERRNRTATEAVVDEFIGRTGAYLRAAYPEVETAGQREEQRLLSRVFWGHLTEARYAAGRSASDARHDRFNRQRRTAVLV